MDLEKLKTTLEKAMRSAGAVILRYAGKKVPQEIKDLAQISPMVYSSFGPQGVFLKSKYERYFQLFQRIQAGAF